MVYFEYTERLLLNVYKGGGSMPGRGGLGTLRKVRKKQSNQFLFVVTSELWIEVNRSVARSMHD